MLNQQQESYFKTAFFTAVRKSVSSVVVGVFKNSRKFWLLKHFFYEETVNYVLFV